CTPAEPRRARRCRWEKKGRSRRLLVGDHARAGGGWGRSGQLEAVDFVGQAEGYALFGGEEAVAARVDEALPPVGVLRAGPLGEDMADQVLIVAGEDGVVAEDLLVGAGYGPLGGVEHEGGEGPHEALVAGLEDDGPHGIGVPGHDGVDGDLVQ